MEFRIGDEPPLSVTSLKLDVRMAMMNAIISLIWQRDLAGFRYEMNEGR